MVYTTRGKHAGQVSLVIRLENYPQSCKKNLRYSNKSTVVIFDTPIKQKKNTISRDS